MTTAMISINTVKATIILVLFVSEAFVLKGVVELRKKIDKSFFYVRISLFYRRASFTTNVFIFSNTRFYDYYLYAL